jgi:hypothetical protein
MIRLTRRQLLAMSAAFLVAPRLGQAADARVVVEVDPVFEWIFALARVAGFDEFRKGLPEWNEAVDTACGSLQEHPVLDMLKTARKKEGVSYDALPRLAAWLDGPPEALSARVPWSPWPPDLDDRWRKTDLPALVAAAADAARIVQFSKVFSDHAPLLHSLSTMLETGVQSFDLAWFEAFFGGRAPGRVRVLASPSTGVHNFGAEADVAGVHEVFAVLGAQIRQGVPSFEDAIGLLVHEVGHAFVGPIVDSNRAAFEHAGTRLFAAVEKAMLQRAYGSWPTVVEESLLRACVVRYFGDHDGAAAAEKRCKVEKDSGFPWVSILAARLLEYEADRTRWPTLGAFVPQMATTLETVAVEVEAKVARAPKVVSTVPADGARDVDPRCSTLVVTFDRPMAQGSWSVVGGGPAFPKTSDPRYDAAHKVFTITIALEPDHDYELWLNSERFQSFRAENGEPLAPVHLRFRTRLG